MPFEYRYPRPALTVDCAVFAPDDGSLDVLLVERAEPPFEGEWATPGGFVEIDEPIGDAASRELAEETGLRDLELEEFATFGAPGRDPRGRIVAVGHWALVDREQSAPEAASDARDCEWHATDDLPEMAFDHRELVGRARGALRSRARTGAVGRGVLSEPFSFEAIRELYDCVLGDGVAPETLREVLVDRTGVLRAPETDGAPDPDAEVFEFDDAVYDRLRRTPISPWID